MFVGSDGLQESADSATLPALAAGWLVVCLTPGLAPCGRGVLQELDSVVTRARMFTYKPDGDVTLTKSQDAHGLPAPLMQDPIHYPHGTKFMAPGATPIPAGATLPAVRQDTLSRATPSCCFMCNLCGRINCIHDRTCVFAADCTGVWETACPSSQLQD